MPTRDMVWLLPCVQRNVRGFAKAKWERSHAKKHFLSKVERWEDTGARPKPENFRGQLDEKRRTKSAILADAAMVYVHAVRRATTTAARHHAVGTDANPENGPSIWVVTQTGIFAAFKPRNPVSDLATAYRPEPRGANLGTGVQDYFNRARDKLRRKQNQGGPP